MLASGPVHLDNQQEAGVSSNMWQGKFKYANDRLSNGEYSLFFANCEPSALVSFKLEAHMFNLDKDGTRNYLPEVSTSGKDSPHGPCTSALS